jgi:sec-independent protein translocase protein TatA
MHLPLGRTILRTEWWFGFWFIGASLDEQLIGLRPVDLESLFISSSSPNALDARYAWCSPSGGPRMFRNPTTDLIIVLVVVLLIFGPKRLPGLGRQLGQGLREFKESITGESKESEDAQRPELTRASETPVVPSAGTAPQRESVPTAPTAATPARDSADIGSERHS